MNWIRGELKRSRAVTNCYRYTYKSGWIGKVILVIPNRRRRWDGWWRVWENNNNNDINSRSVCVVMIHSPSTARHARSVIR